MLSCQPTSQASGTLHFGFKFYLFINVGPCQLPPPTPHALPARPWYVRASKTHVFPTLLGAASELTGGEVLLYVLPGTRWMSTNKTATNFRPPPNSEPT